MFNYDPIEESRPICWDCQEKETKIDDAAEGVAAIIEALYSTDFPNLMLLENSLRDLAYSLDIPDVWENRNKLPNGLNHFLKEWVNSHQEELKALKAL